MTAYFATTTQDPFSKLIRPESSIQGTFNVTEPSLYSQNDEHLIAQKPVAKKNSAARSAIGLVLYALGLFLFAYGQLVQPSLLLMLAGSAVLVFSCYTFIPEIKGRTTNGSEDDDLNDDADVSNS
jgi:hypothetical protein